MNNEEIEKLFTTGLFHPDIIKSVNDKIASGEYKYYRLTIEDIDRYFEQWKRSDRIDQAIEKAEKGLELTVEEKELLIEYSKTKEDFLNRERLKRVGKILE